MWANSIIFLQLIIKLYTTMKKIFFLMFAGLLTLSACNNNDEPNDPDDITGKIYLAVRNAFEEGDVVITAKGDIIYQCAPKTVIRHFLVDGSDWYAIAHQWHESSRDVDIIIKNGNIIHTTVEHIYDLCIDDGNIYTVESEGLEHKQWVCKNFTHIYSLLTDQFSASQMVVNHGDITLAPSSSNDACYWHNGEFIAMQGLNGGVDVCFIDKDGDDVLMGVNRDKYDKTGYWRNGSNYSHLNITDYITQVKLVGGKSYLLGMHYTSAARNSQGIVVATSSDAIVVIDGQEQVLRTTGNTNNYAKSMFLHNNDIYILVREYVTETTGNKSFIYKNMKPIRLGRDVTEREVIDFAIIGS